MLIDSHCHLEYEGLADRQDEALQNARNAGVKGFVNISTKKSEWAQVLATAAREKDVWASVGVHPHNADDHHDLAIDDLLTAAEHPKAVAIGETGLDYHYDKSDRDVQKSLFRRHIEVARERGLPVVIHTRDAEEDTAFILKEELGKGAFPALIHCFTASEHFGEEMLKLGLTISLSGIVTFKNAKNLQKFARKIPEDRLLVETDSPFLAPVPNRGKVCEPAFVRDTAAFIADLRGVSFEELAETTTRNFTKLFKKAVI
ncbi:MAG: TatD family hydrolase [Pontixanthobacter sp.]